MPKKEERSEKIVSFWGTASANYDEVQKWPKWKQSIVISSCAASTGRFYVERESSPKKEKK